jgi:hypothetical protein
LTQSVYQLMNKNTVASLEIIEGMNKDYPQADIYKSLLEAVAEEPVGFGIGVYRWLNGKIDLDVKSLYKDKKINEVLNDF